MWPFKSKPKSNPSEEVLDKLRAFREVGETFNYLGRTCIVTGHFDLLPLVGFVPMLKFDYCDDLGVLHSMSAGVGELPGLIKQQESEKGA